jgi:hypothetical protein
MERLVAFNEPGKFVWKLTTTGIFTDKSMLLHLMKVMRDFSIRTYGR